MTRSSNLNHASQILLERVRSDRWLLAIMEGADSGMFGPRTAFEWFLAAIIEDYGDNPSVISECHVQLLDEASGSSWRGRAIVPLDLLRSRPAFGHLSEYLCQSPESEREIHSSSNLVVVCTVDDQVLVLNELELPL